jgi:hypothetical protein
VDAAKYRADADALLTSIRRAASGLRNALVDRSLLTAQEASANPKIEVTVSDTRSKSHEPLPAIDWRLDH